jgi:two-component system NarL family response regulator
VREGLRRILGSFEQIEILGEASGGREAIAVAHALKPDVVVMDITMPEMGGIEATGVITRELPTTKVLALSMHDNRNYVTQALRMGARGYILKDSAPAELVNAITEVFEGSHPMSHQAAEAVITSRFSQAGGADLSPREIEVLRFIARGLTNKEIGEALGLSVRTVESHREKLIRKLKLPTVAELTRYAVTHGFVEGNAVS